MSLICEYYCLKQKIHLKRKSDKYINEYNWDNKSIYIL